MPLIAFNLLDSIALLSTSSRNFGSLCIRQVSADRERAAALIERSLAMATFLTPAIGYDKAAAIAKEAYESGRNVREVAMEQSGLSAEKIEDLFAPLHEN